MATTQDDPSLHLSTVATTSSAPKNKAVVIGLYGVPGSGKTFLIDKLKAYWGEKRYEFYEGSQVIDSVIPGGLAAFHKLAERDKPAWRQEAIRKIGQQCASNGRVAVVTGHFMFWTEDEANGRLVYTQDDLETYTHILYLDIPAEVIIERRKHHATRQRPQVSVDHLQKWQQAEIAHLRQLCRHNDILFLPIKHAPGLVNYANNLLGEFSSHTETYNLREARLAVDEALRAKRGELKTILVMDADRTLAATDTGALFWDKVSTARGLNSEAFPMKSLFSSPMGYSYTAFRQATLLYEELYDDQEFESFCQAVALDVALYPDILSLLRTVADHKHVGAVIVTCGIRRVWELILMAAGLSAMVKVVGGSRIVDGFVVTPDVKAALVSHIQEIHKASVWAFGDSPMDLPMMEKADHAIVVVGNESTRSESMDVALMAAIANGLQAHQVVFPGTETPRLSITDLPLIRLTDKAVIDSIIGFGNDHARINVRHATDRESAKVLMTVMRNANVSGPALREAHRRVGWYLATEFLANVVGLEEYPIPHVQGHSTSGYRLLHEQKTSVVALMRGGEPMALGVNDALPLATFVHAKATGDITPEHVQGQHTIVLVDSVVNSGKSVLEFVQHIRSFNKSIRIVVVAGVVQSQCVADGAVARALARHGNVSVIALRLSDNKFTGKGTTDTGNRLFNTTHLD